MKTGQEHWEVGQERQPEVRLKRTLRPPCCVVLSEYVGALESCFPIEGDFEIEEIGAPRGN